MSRGTTATSGGGERTDGPFPAGGAWTDRQGRPGRLGVAFAAVWLVFLVYALRAAWDLLPGVRGVLGLLFLAGFVAVYLASFTWIRRRRQLMVLLVEPRNAALILGSLVALGLALTLAVGQEGTATAVYVSVVSVMCLRGLWALGVVLALAVATEVSGALVPGWDQAGRADVRDLHLGVRDVGRAAADVPQRRPVAGP